ncbi:MULTISPECIES: hypothetical protein [Paenibacillus]|uniref:Uncharacterized protein n=1 Tax=Paenibacillus peoriae TaxID=59893 RepID=A0A7H0YF75_9BACL|nr:MULTISPECIES: hypothetical protein [Paenibacillus]QNR69733.1 hypothetical protein IAQ67_12410 [Paenibacillus peoriae]
MALAHRSHSVPIALTACLQVSRSRGIHYNKASIDYKDEAWTSGERKGRKGVDDYG